MSVTLLGPVLFPLSIYCWLKKWHEEGPVLPPTKLSLASIFYIFVKWKNGSSNLKEMKNIFKRVHINNDNLWDIKKINCPLWVSPSFGAWIYVKTPFSVEHLLLIEKVTWRGASFAANKIISSLHLLHFSRTLFGTTCSYMQSKNI